MLWLPSGFFFRQRETILASFAQGKIDILQAKSNIELRYAINLARGYSIECLVRVTQPPAFSQILGTS